VVRRREKAQDDARSVAQTIDDAEARVREVVPSARLIFLEPDIARTP
jgi:uncharacterized coiled-coil DUF342 family protein